MPVCLSGMIFGVSLGGFNCVLLCVDVVRVRQMRVLSGFIVVAVLVLFGCHAVMARSLFIVLCCRVVVLCSCSGDGKIRRFCAVGVCYHP